MSRYPQNVNRTQGSGLLAGVRIAVANFVHRLAKARRRRLEEERAFYRELNEYRMAQNLTLVYPDD